MKRYKFNNLKDFEMNSSAACYLSSLNLPYNTLIGLLRTDEFHLKHFALTNLNSIDSKGMDILLSNLTGQDSKIRECSSSRIRHFILENPELACHLEKNIDIVCKSLYDVNPQVCRNMIDTFVYLKDKDIFIEKILNGITSILNEFDIKNIVKSHKFNKKVFNLYWNLYAMENLLHPDIKDSERLYSIIETVSQANNYTIRERAAKIVIKLDKLGFDVEQIKNELSKDDNFYVKAAIFSYHSSV